MTRCRVPRYLHTDMPLGNALGAPGDHAAQKQTVADALALIDSATTPVTARADLHWSDSEDWKENYMRTNDPEALARAGVENREKRKAERAAGLRRPSL